MMNARRPTVTVIQVKMAAETTAADDVETVKRKSNGPDASLQMAGIKGYYTLLFTGMCKWIVASGLRLRTKRHSSFFA